MTTVNQPDQSIETEFGTAELRDWRTYSNPVESARIYFDELVINRKSYGSFSVDVSRIGGKIHLRPNNGYNIRLTEAAYKKLTAALSTPELLKLYEPYLEPLDESDVRSSLKSHLKSRVLYHINNDLPFKPDDQREMGPALMDEILLEILNDRSLKLTYSQIASKS